MNRIVDVVIRTMAVLACSGFVASAPAGAQTQLADVTSVHKIEIREVNSSTGVASIQVEFNLTGAANASVLQAALRDFSLDNVLLLPQPSSDSFELKNHQALVKELVFSTPITPQMAPLMKKFGQKVRVSGTLKLTGQAHGSLFGKKPLSAESVFSGDAVMVTPDEQVRASITKLPYFTAVATPEAAGVKPVLSSDQGADKWMAEMKKRGAANVVIVEASADAGLGLVQSKLYRHGYRINDHQVVGPMDLADPLAVHAHKEDSVLGDAVANVSRKLNGGEVQYRAWIAASPGAAQDRLSYDLPTSSLRLKCRLTLDTGMNPGLALFELTSPDKSRWEALDVDNAPEASLSAMGLAYTGLSDNQPFTSAVLLSTPLSGAVSGPSLTLSSRVAAPVFGSPLFTQRGLAAIINGPDSAVTASELRRAMQSAACTTPAPAKSPSTVETAAAGLVKVKVVSNPDGSLVWIDHKLAMDDASRPIMTAASKAACTGANTAVLARGRHYISFVHEGYQDVSGYVQVDDDMTLTATLVRQKVTP